VIAPGEKKPRRVLQVSTEIVPVMKTVMELAADSSIDIAVVRAAAEKMTEYLQLPDDGVTRREIRGIRIRLWIKLAVADGARSAPAAIRDWLLAHGRAQAELPGPRMFRKALRELGYPPS
jgi:hypothetical protein